MGLVPNKEKVRGLLENSIVGPKIKDIQNPQNINIKE